MFFSHFNRRCLKKQVLCPKQHVVSPSANWPWESQLQHIVVIFQLAMLVLAGGIKMLFLDSIMAAVIFRFCVYLFGDLCL